VVSSESLVQVFLNTSLEKEYFGSPGYFGSKSKIGSKLHLTENTLKMV